MVGRSCRRCWAKIERLVRWENDVKKILFLAAALIMASGVAEAKNPHGDSLPPGLQKKVDRGGELPPGWKKKLARGEILSEDIYSHGHVVEYDDCCEKVYVEDQIIKVIKDTREIVDILQH